MSMTIFGLSEFFGALTRVSADVEEGTKRAIEKGLAMIEAKAKENASGGGPGPEVETGTLRRGVRSTKVHRAGLSGWQGEVGPTVIYSRRIDLGFIGEDAIGRVYAQQPLPFFTPAWNSEIRKVAELYAAEWGRALTGL